MDDSRAEQVLYKMNEKHLVTPETNKQKKGIKKKKKKLAKTSRVCAKDLGPNLNILPLPKDGQRLPQA